MNFVIHQIKVLLFFKLVGAVKQTSREILSADAHTLAELEQKICISAEEAVNAYNNAVYIIKQYNQVKSCLIYDFAFS